MVNNDAEVKIILDVIIEPRRSTFYHENCALKVLSMSSTRDVFYEGIQSSNANYLVGTAITFEK